MGGVRGVGVGCKWDGVEGGWTEGEGLTPRVAFRSLEDLTWFYSDAEMLAVWPGYFECHIRITACIRPGFRWSNPSRRHLASNTNTTPSDWHNDSS